MKNYDGSGTPVDNIKGAGIPVGARILRPVMDYDLYLSSGLDEKQAYDKLLAQKQRYDPNVLKSLKKVISALDDMEIEKVNVAQLKIGMIIMQDIKAKDGLLIINKGHQVTEARLEHLRMFSRQRKISEPVEVTWAE